MQVFQFSLAFWEAMMGRWPYRSMCVDYDCFLQIFSWGWREMGAWGQNRELGWVRDIHLWFVTVLHLSLVDWSCWWEELSSVPNGQIAASAPSRPPTPGIWWDQLEQNTFLWAAVPSARTTSSIAMEPWQCFYSLFYSSFLQEWLWPPWH